ncbi:MAG: crossover junction endodeoxyribonuclease RuvC [Parcubacteria group bacterium]|nr:crossover junction endodeoxyribonuclease RuvC [Parcubacteria group bacterium]
MIILGIDPGTTRIGFGVVEKQGSTFHALASGLFKSPANPLLFEKELLTLLKKHKPDAVSIEKVFFGKNQKTALAVSEMRGVIKFIIQKQNILILEYTPLEIKQSITGYGRAEKQQLEKLTLKILNVSKKPKYDDESDALAIALSGALSYPMYIKTRNLTK